MDQVCIYEKALHLSVGSPPPTTSSPARSMLSINDALLVGLMMMMLLNHVDEKPNKGEESNKAGNENKEDGANKESSGVSNPDEAQMNNIDLGGVLNLAAEDTLNIRFLNIREPP